MNIWEEIKQSFKSGSLLTKLIYINLAVFITVRILHVITFFFMQAKGFSIIEWLAVPADTDALIRRPWTLITYMFLQFDFIHILFNLLVLYWFGRLFTEYLDDKKLLTTYLLGGLAGGLLFILSFNLIPAFSAVKSETIALGASASVMAIVIGISFYAPNRKINLMFIGPVQLKYIALVYILLDVLSIAGANAGGHIAHIGGALYGILFATQLKKGKDIGSGFGRFLYSIFDWFKPRKKMKVTYKNTKGKTNVKKETDMDYNARKAHDQATIDSILEKIARSGYDSLSKKEKEILFRMSDKN